MFNAGMIERAVCQELVASGKFKSMKNILDTLRSKETLIINPKSETIEKKFFQLTIITLRSFSPMHFRYGLSFRSSCMSSQSSCAPTDQSMLIIPHMLTPSGISVNAL